MYSKALAKFVRILPFARKLLMALAILSRRVIQLEKKVASMEEETRERSRELARYVLVLSLH
jgi:hypothetical protein